ncbi:hypothetical protein [Thalassotalea montiporae]
MSKFDKLSNVLFIVLIWPVIAFTWLDSVDPPFINNSISIFFNWWFIPILVISVYIFVITKYKKDEKYRKHIQNLLKTELKKNWFYYLISPIFLYGVFYVYLAPNFILASYYFSSTNWSSEYVVTKTKNCGSDYESSCIKVFVKNIEDKTEDNFRWYDDKQLIHNLANQRIKLSGVESFGRIIEQIEW